MTALSHWSCEGSRAAISTRSGPTLVCVPPSRAANPPPPPDKNRPKRIYAWEREVSAVKATQLNTACNKKAASRLWLPSGSHPTISETQPSRPDLSSSSTQSFSCCNVVGRRCCAVLHWSEHRCMAKWEETPKDTKRYLKRKRGRGEESWRWRSPTPNRSAAITDQLDGLDRTRAEVDNREALINQHWAWLWV